MQYPNKIDNISMALCTSIIILVCMYFFLTNEKTAASSIPLKSIASGKFELIPIKADSLNLLLSHMRDRSNVQYQIDSSSLNTFTINIPRLGSDPAVFYSHNRNIVEEHSLFKVEANNQGGIHAE